MKIYTTGLSPSEVFALGLSYEHHPILGVPNVLQFALIKFVVVIEW